MTAAVRSPKGFTLIESILVMSLLGLLFGLATPYLFGTKEKTSLETETEKLVNQLKMIQQDAIAAREGQTYSLLLLPNSNQYRLAAGTEQEKTFSLQYDLVSPAGETALVFSQLTGQPNQNLQISLESKRFRTTISLSLEGLITFDRAQVK